MNGVDGKVETIITQLPGQNGENATSEQIQSAVNDYFVTHPVKDGAKGDKGDSGIKGDQGDPGAMGQIIFVRQTLLGAWECRIGNDLGWSPIEECQ